MDGLPIPLADAAARLGVSHRRARALAARGQLDATKVGGQWFVSREALDRFVWTRSRRRGRPVNASTAWKEILELAALREAPRDLDTLRRELRPRACHEELYVHPGLLDRVRRHPVALFGGRDAAAKVAPVDLTDEVDVYLGESDANRLVAEVNAVLVADGANLHLHRVDHDQWAYVDGHRDALDLVLAWLDLADRADRAADVVLDHLWANRVRA